MSETARIAGEEALRTNPVGFVAKGIQGLKSAVFPMAVAAYSMRDQNFGLIGAAALGLVIAGLGIGLSYLRWRRFTYSVGETDIRVESGILARAARSVPYERIQDVSLEQSLIPRLFGLVEVKFETGAGGKDELTLAYLAKDEGERLRELVRARRDGVSAEPSVEGEALEAAIEPPATTLFSMDTKRLVTFGLFEFSLAIVAVVGGLLQQFGDFLPFDIWELSEWQENFAGPFHWLEALGPSAQVAGAVLAIGSLLVIGMFTGVVRTVLRDWNFLLERTAKGFRRRRGLVTRTDVVMPAHRVQAVKIGTGIIRRRFGWHGLSFVTLAQDSGAANHVVAPFGRIEELNPIIQASGFEPPASGLAWQRASRQFRTDGALVNMLVMTAVAIGVSFTPKPLFALLPLGFGLILAARELFLWRHERNALSGNQLFIGSGWLAPKLSIASRVKLQSVEISQGPLSRWRGYATLHLGLAGGTLKLEGIPLERARELRRAVLASISGTDFSELTG